MKAIINLTIFCKCGTEYNFLGPIEYSPGNGFYKEIKEEMEELGWIIPKNEGDELKCPECAGDIEVYCHGCSVAGGADRAIHHAPPVCE